MKTMLTDRALRAMKPAAPGTRKMIWDSSVPSFGIRATDKGKLTFIVMRRMNGKLVRRMIGQYPIMPLAEAREAALSALRDIQRGIDPKEKKAAERRAEAKRRADSFSTVAEEFITRHVRKLRSGHDSEAAIRRELISRWSEKPITEISKRDVIALIEEIADSRRPAMARKIFAHLTKLFSWAIARDVYGIESSPCATIKLAALIGSQEARQHVLSDNEILAVWRAANSLGYPAAPFVQMLLITGQRLREVAEMRWSEVDFGKALWVIPGERMKGGITHEVPLSKMAVQLLGSIRRWQGDHIFTTTGGMRPIGGFSNIKKRIDAAIGEAIAPWRYHDLRRTMRTGLGALPIPANVAEMVIAHAQPGLHQIYDRHSYRSEKACALELWAARLAEIVEPGPSDNVIPMTARG